MYHVQVATVDDRDWDLGSVGSGSEDALAFVPMDVKYNAPMAVLVGNTCIF